MVICIKCGKEQSRRSSSECEYKYVYNERGDIEHAWVDRREFIDELRAKLPPFIRGRIEEWRKNYADKQAQFAERLQEHSKDLDEFNRWQDQRQASYAEYLKEWLPRDVEKKRQQAKRRAIRPFLLNMIGSAIGLFISFKWIIPLFNLGIPDLYINLAMIVLAVFILGKAVVELLKAKRHAESHDFTDEVASEWRNDTGFDKVKASNDELIKMEETDLAEVKDKWNKISGSFERCIHDAERALAGSDEELLHFYNMDKQTKNWYIKNIYEGAW